MVHTFSSGSMHVAYDIENMVFYRLSDEGWEQAQRGEFIFDHTPPPLPAQNGTATTTPGVNKIPLERLVLIITTHCNLRCRYCYAEGGDYGMAQLHMPIETADKAIDWAFRHFSSIGTIQFFGGEPSLNPSLIEAICEAVDDRVSSGELDESQRPQYGMVTNGVHLTPHLENIVERYQIHLTYSFDGPAKVHDYHRVSVGGNGSFKAAAINFHKMQAKGKNSLATEMTLTPEALKAGYGVWELAMFSAEELQLLEPHIVPVFTEPGTPVAQWDAESSKALVESYRRAAVLGLDALLNGRFTSFSFLSGMLRTLILRRKRTFICPAGAGTLAIDPNGDVYPCFMFTGQPAQQLTNISNHDPLNFTQSLDNFNQHNHKANRVNCQTCWVRHLCTGCIGNHHYSTGSLAEEWALMCQIMKVIAEEVMLFLTSIREHPDIWQQFVTQYKRYRIPSSIDQC